MNEDILTQYKKIHFVGIGGISMSALAEYCMGEGFIVSGSDVKSNEQTAKLQSFGVKVYIGHSAKNVKNPDLVVYTSAVDEKNPEVARAIEKNIPVFTRAEFLGGILKRFSRVIAVCGSHGKTTVTTMIAEIFSAAGKEPTVFVGGSCDDFGNYKKGKKDFCIAEACEYKKNFLKLPHDVSVVLNIDDDHLDSYKNMDDEIGAFGCFARGGIAVINADDERCKKIFNPASITYGTAERASYRAVKIKKEGENYSFDLIAYGVRRGRISLSVPLKHNVYNALAAVAVAEIYGINFKVVKTALEKFSGVKRRFERIGTFNGKDCYADYAHHPSEIKSTLSGADTRKTVVVFQPHTYSRTRLLMAEFVDALSPFINIIIYKTYAARESFDKEGSAERLASTLKGKGVASRYCRTPSELKTKLTELSNEDVDRVMFVGAGDIYDVAVSLVDKPATR